MAIENVVVKQSTWTERDIEILFGKEEIHFTQTTDIASLVVELGIFPSKSQARKAGREGEISAGFTNAFKASKRHRLWIWNPDK